MSRKYGLKRSALLFAANTVRLSASTFSKLKINVGSHCNSKLILGNTSRCVVDCIWLEQIWRNKHRYI
ncbi:MAG: hypothetical protein AB8B94_06525, partial [Hyphomicrobiales bacterium]